MNSSPIVEDNTHHHHDELLTGNTNNNTPPPTTTTTTETRETTEEFCGDDDCQYIFPQRLMSILEDEKNHDAICWLPHGRAFIIRNRKSFAEKIMPRFFSRKSKYSSFTRKLNRWYVSREAVVVSLYV
jgi:hypothetical protein